MGSNSLMTSHSLSLKSESENSNNTEFLLHKTKYNYQNIQFAGFVNGDKKYSLIKKAEFIIVPSVCFENYPLAIVEAFCCGIPVIGSKIGGIPFIIEDNKDGFLFEPNDFNSLKKVLNKIQKNVKLRETMGENARETFFKKMEFSNNIKRLEEVYRNVING